MRRKRRRHDNRRYGSTVAYMTVAMTALAAFCALGVDFGRVRLAKAELSRAADAAARAAAVTLGVGGSTSAARSEAIEIAGYHTADGSAIVLQSGDVVFGKWNATTNTLDTSSPSPDAVRITARRTNARGNAVPTVFGQVIGLTSADLVIDSVAQVSSSGPTGFIGVSSFTAQNNLSVGSYTSTSTTSPTWGGSDDNSLIGSNGAVSGGNGNTVKGDVVLGSGGTLSGISRTGTTLSVSSTATPASPAWSPGTNPGSTPQSYSVSGNTTLAGGTYWFTSLTVSGTLSFSGAATVYLNGNANISGMLRAYNSVPGNLKIYQIGARTFGDSNGNGIDITADISAPGSAFQAKNNLTFRGRMTFNTIDVKNNATLFYDEALGAATGTTTIVTVE